MLNAADSFERRVRALRDSWEERRDAKRFSRASDFESQLELLLRAHEWATFAAVGIGAAYGGELGARVSGIGEGDNPSFRLTVAEHWAIEVRLDERPPGNWRLTAEVVSPGLKEAPLQAPRRTYWTRREFEELVLSLLGSYERSLAAIAGPGGPTPARRNGSRANRQRTT